MRLLGLSMIAQMTLFSAAFAQEPTESQPESSQADEDTDAPETDAEVQSELAEKLERNATVQTEDDTNDSDETEEVVNEMAPTEGDIASYRDTLERYSLRMQEFEKEAQDIVRLQKEQEIAALKNVYSAIVDELNRDKEELSRTTIGRFEDFLRKYPNEDRSASIMFRLGNLYFEEIGTNFGNEIERLMNAEEFDLADEIRKDYSKPIDLFQGIIDRFPQSEFRDAALYMYALCHLEDKSEQYEVQTYIDTFRLLIDEYPESRYAPQSNFYLALGYFDKNEMSTAISYFEKALVGAKEGSSLYEFALYGLAWAYYKKDDFENSLRVMTDVLDYSEREKKRRGDGALVAPEALTYLAFSFADIGDREGIPPHEVTIKYYEEIGERPYEADVYKELARQLKEIEQFDNEIQVYKYMQERWPGDPENPNYQYRIAEIYGYMGAEEELSAAMAELTERYDDDSEWWRLNRNNPDAQAVAQRYIEQSLISVADDQINKAIEIIASGDVVASQEAFAKAADLYGRYLSKFPFAGDYYRNQWLMSISLEQSMQFREAIVQFNELIDSATDHNYKETADFRKMLVYQQIIKDLHQNEFSLLPQNAELEAKRTMPSGNELSVYKLQDDHLLFIESYEKTLTLDFDSRVTVIQKQIAELNDDIDAAEENQKRPLEVKLEELSALELEINNYSQALNGVRFQIDYIIGQIMFAHGRYEDARLRMEAVMAQNPLSLEAEYAASLIIRTYQDEENWEMVRDSAQRFMSMQLGPNGKIEDFAAFEQNANLRLAELIDKRAKELLEQGKIDEATVQFNMAGQAFEQFLTDYPESKDVQNAMLLAAFSYQSGGNTIKANYFYKLFVDTYPSDERSRSFIFTIATNYENSLDYDSAIRYYEVLYNQTYGRGIEYEDAISAYFNTALLKVGLGDFKGAAKRFEEYERRHTDMPNAESAMYSAGEYWEKVGIWPAIDFYFRYLKKYEGEDASRTFEAQYKVATLLEKGKGSNKKIEASWNDLISAYEAAATAGTATPIMKRYVTLYKLRGLPDELNKLEKLKYIPNRNEATDKKNAEVVNSGFEMKDEIVAFCKDIQNVGDLEALMASYYCYAYVDNYLGKKIGDYPIPDFLPYEVQDIYIENLDAQKAPLLESGKTGFIQILEISKRENVWNEWSDKALAELNKLDAKSYPPPKSDLRGSVKSDFTPTLGPVSPEEPEPEEQPNKKLPATDEPNGEVIVPGSDESQSEGSNISQPDQETVEEVENNSQTTDPESESTDDVSPEAESSEEPEQIGNEEPSEVDEPQDDSSTEGDEQSPWGAE